MLFCTALFCCFSVIASSQTENTNNRQVRSPNLYLGLGGGGCNEGYTLGINGAVIYPNSWGMSVGFDSYAFRTRNMPKDYQSGLKFSDPFSGDNMPQDHINSLSFCLNKEFTTRFKRLRAGVDLGPTYVNYVQKIFRPNPNPGWLGSNYLISESSKGSVGLFLRCRADFAMARFCGVEMAMVANTNDAKPYFGWELFVLFGKLM